MEKLDVIYEDNQIVVVIKPQNIPSQSDISKDEDMLTLVKSYVKEKYAKPGEAYIGLVHRLDRPTGGVMVFARTSKSASRLSAQIADGSFSKTYLAVVCGTPRDKSATLVNYLKKDPADNMVRLVPMSESGAKRAELKFEVLESKDGLSLLKIKILTGRSHQIRVQLANIGCPLYGDGKYGAKKGLSKNLALWAYSLEFKHPTKEEDLLFKIYPPEDAEPWSKFDLEKYLK